MKMSAAIVAAMLAGGLLVTGCASVDDDSRAAATRALADPGTTTTTAAPAPTTPDCKDEQGDALRSYAPNGVSADPRQVPGLVMKDILEKDVIRVGVDDNTLGLSARNPRTGELEGAEVTLARLIASAILGDPGKVRLVAVTTDDKVSAVKDRKVDITIDAISMSCKRWHDVLFTSEYHTAQHKLLVRDDSPIDGIANVAGKRVCVTKGSSSEVYLDGHPTGARKLVRDFRNDCLRALQQGRADAYFSHDTILSSARQQDHTLKIVGDPVQPQHYGIAVAQGNVELVRFLNALLEEWRGSKLQDFEQSLGDAGGAVPAAQYRDAAR